MNFDQKVSEITQQTHDKNAAVDQFAVSQTPFHTHNGSDSQQISAVNLINRTQLINVLLPGTSPATAGNYGTFFIAPYKCVFIGAQEVHQTAGSDSAPVFLQIEKLTGTTASGSGTNLLQYGVTVASVAAGGADYVVGDTITLTGGSGTQAVLKVLTVSAGAVTSVTVNSSGAYTAFPANPVSQGSTSGIGTGATFNLTFIDGFNLKGTANTVQTGVLSQTSKTNFNLARGDRLGMVLAGTPTAVAHLTLIVQIQY